MPSLALAEKLIWFAHCPKAGGTSVEQFMVARWGGAVGHLHWGWDLWWKSGGWKVASPPNSPQHLVWADALATLPRPPDTVFTVVRDPIARISSEHRWQRHGRRGTQLGKALAWLPFPIWLRLMVAVVERNPHAYDNHFRPQSDFVPEAATVFRLEDGLEQVECWLNRLACEPADHISMPHAIATGRPNTIGAAEQSLIASVFAIDYARFEYTRPPDARPRKRPADWVANWIAPAIVWLDRRGRI